MLPAEELLATSDASMKRSHRGGEIPNRDRELIEARLREAQARHEETTR